MLLIKSFHADYKTKLVGVEHSGEAVDTTKDFRTVYVANEELLRRLQNEVVRLAHNTYTENGPSNRPLQKHRSVFL